MNILEMQQGTRCTFPKGGCKKENIRKRRKFQMEEWEDPTEIEDSLEILICTYWAAFCSLKVA